MPQLTLVGKASVILQMRKLKLRVDLLKAEQLKVTNPRLGPRSFDLESSTLSTYQIAIQNDT